MLPRVALLVAIVASLTPCSPATAHEYWLAPSVSRGAERTAWSVGGFVGTGFRGEARPYQAARAVRFELRGWGPGAVTDLKSQAREGDSTWATGTMQRCSTFSHGFQNPLATFRTLVT